MGTLNTKTSKSIHVLFNLTYLTLNIHQVSHLQQLRYRVLIGKIVSINMLLWYGRTHVMNSTHEFPEI